MRKILSQLSQLRAIISSPPHKYLKEKIISINSSYLSPWIHMPISCFIQFSMLAPYVWILSNGWDWDLISSQKNLILDLQKDQIKRASSKENFKWESYFIGIMFLHKFDTLNRNSHVLFQKVLPVLTKWGDLTVCFVQ
jgi:hypothetical protein